MLEADGMTIVFGVCKVKLNVTCKRIYVVTI